MAEIKGFANTTQFGRALASVGDDFASAASDQRRAGLALTLEQLRAERAQSIAELKAEVQRELQAQRNSVAGRRGAPQLTTKQKATIGGLTEDDYLAAGWLAETGGEKVPEEGPLAPGDAPTMVESERTVRGKRHLPTFRAVETATAFPPNEADDFVRAFETTKILNDTTLDDATRAKKMAALQGRGSFRVQGDTLVDQFTGDSELTDRGRQRGDAERTRANRPVRQASTSEMRDANTAVETARRVVNDARRSAENLLLKSNPRSMAMSPDERASWIASRPAVQEAERGLAAATARHRKLLAGDDTDDEPAPAPKRADGLPPGVTRAQAIAEANAAIKRGYDKAAVVKRLESWGIRDHGIR